jgi:cytochrome c oxidase cbb3-type subunit III
VKTVQLKNGLAAVALAGLSIFCVHLAAQNAPPPAAPPQPPPAAPAAPGDGRGQGRGGRGAPPFPAQQRPPGDPALIERGKTIYGLTCASCHGADLRGGQLNGPNLLRSQLVLNDKDGELIQPIVNGARAEKGMPPIPLPPDDVRAVATYIHSVLATAQGQGAPPATAAPLPDILVGDARLGETYFAAKCSACHSVTGDLRGIGARIPDARLLQNIWVSGGLAAGRGGRGGGVARPRAIVTVTQPSGEKVEGQLVRYDDFLVTLTDADGATRTFRRDSDRPKVEIRDPFDGHRALLAVYSDKDIHDVTAYLVTLK